ncbi:CCA tRNA nucleotidyltransferase [Bdellovibrio sp. NC01]|uniref:CCA tRNA nucleotidyltransferase n=1 Tax=Bdellovibrio sp. NC01 TaxID=2220073 RepID=UPI00115AF1DA|nr:CCA tRNA nucleotidyltransferase [Bdellovibrio sp. NC01]QDK37647.1 CCA tRNA nucleotidyltransferase [Bdellovibrio sp. NC01]
MSQVRTLLHSHPHWAAVQSIYHKLSAQGYKAFLAGGCVRDALLGLEANDLDIATSATPDQIEQLFDKTVNVGKSFGVMRVIVDGADVEVATFRTDMEYKDGRRPEGVIFSSPEEDAQRRDFTINALFFDLATEQVLDFVQGQEDLKKQIIRTVGEAKFRFEEDQLRLLRAARFSAQLDFKIEDKTFQAMTTMATAVTSVSGERIRDEMAKLFKSKNPERGLKVMNECGLMAVLFPFHVKEHQWPRSLYQAGELDTWKAFTLFLAKAPAADLTAALDLLKLSTKERRAIEECLALWSKPNEFFKERLGFKLQALSKAGVLWALQAAKAFAESKVSLLSSDLLSISVVLSMTAHHFVAINELFSLRDSFGENLPKAFLNGEDLKGKLQGEAIGRCLQEAYNLQLERQLTSRDEALKWLQSYQHKGS